MTSPLLGGAGWLSELLAIKLTRECAGGSRDKATPIRGRGEQSMGTTSSSALVSSNFPHGLSPPTNTLSPRTDVSTTPDRSFLFSVAHFSTLCSLSLAETLRSTDEGVVCAITDAAVDELIKGPTPAHLLLMEKNLCTSSGGLEGMEVPVERYRRRAAMGARSGM